MLGAVKRLVDRIGQALAIWRRGYRISQEFPWSGMGQQSAAGVHVDADSALTLSAIFAGVMLLSRVIGCLPLQAYRRSGRKKSVADDLPIYRALHTEANPEMTAAVARRVMEWNRLLFGKAVAEIAYDGAGRPAGYWPLEGWRVEPKRDDAGGLYYLIDGQRRVAPDDMIYVPLVSADGTTGKGFVDYAIESLGMAISAQTFAATFFGNGATPGGVLKHPAERTPEQRAEIRKGWQETHQGPANANKVGLLWGGWEFSPNTAAMSPEQAQLVEARRFGTEEAARWLGIPPHLLRDLTRATFSNIEQQGIDFVVFSLGPTCVEYEQEYDRKLLGRDPSLYTKHNVAGLMRGDSAARAAYYHSLLGDGVLCVNEARDLEDLDPVEGGDVHFVPLNMQPLTEAGKPKPAPAPVPKPAPPTNDPDEDDDDGDPAPDAGGTGLSESRNGRAAHWR